MSEIAKTQEIRPKDTNMPFPVLNPTATVKKIQKTPELSFLLANSILINGIQYILPVLTYRLIQFCMQAANNRDETQNDSFSQAVNQFIQFIFYSLCLRLIIKNTVFNSIATFGSITQLNTDFYDTDQHGALCANCPAGINDTSNLLAHYVLGSMTIAALQTMFSFVPYVGTPTSFALGAYWKGWTAFQYPLARQNICAEHQIALLSQNKRQLAAFGGAFQLLELLVDTIISNVTDEGVPKFVLTKGLSQLLTLFSLMHSQQVGIALPSSLPPVSSQAKSTMQLDPIVLAWKLSIQTSKGIKPLFKYIFAEKKQTPIVIEKLKEISTIANKQPLIRAIAMTMLSLIQEMTNVTTTTLSWIFIAPELQSLQALAAAPAVRPYMLYFLNDMKNILQLPSEHQNQRLVQLLIRALNTPYLGGSLQPLITLAARTVNPAISDDFTHICTKIILMLNQRVQFSEVLTTVNEALKLCKSLPSEGAFGTVPPNLFLERDPFYLLGNVSSSQQASLPSTTDPEWQGRPFTQNAESDDDQPQRSPSPIKNTEWPVRYFAPSTPVIDSNLADKYPIGLSEIYTQLIDVIINHRYVEYAAKNTGNQKVNLSALELIEQMKEEKATIYKHLLDYISSLSETHLDHATLIFILSAIQFIEPILNKNQRLTRDESDKLSNMLTTLVKAFNDLSVRVNSKFLKITLCGNSHSLPGFQRIGTHGIYTHIGSLITNTLKFPLFSFSSENIEGDIQSLISEYQTQANPIPISPKQSPTRTEQAAEPTVFPSPLTPSFRKKETGQSPNSDILMQKPPFS